MQQLNWHNAVGHHRQALSEFVCTDPPKRTYEKHRGRSHPFPYELEVQSHLRGLKIPVAAGEGLILGLDRRGVAAAIHYGFDDSQTQFMIWAVACARRSAGSGYGSQAMQRALEVCAATKAKYRLDSGVFTYIDPRNVKSKKMVSALGFEFLNVYDGYEGWVRDL